MHFKQGKVLVSVHSWKLMAFGASCPLFFRNGQILGLFSILNFYYWLQFPSFYILLQIVLAFTLVPLVLWYRKTIIKRTHLKQVSIHLKSDSAFIGIDCKRQTFNTVRFKSAWMFKPCYCQLAVFWRIFPQKLQILIIQNDFCKNCNGGFGLFILISICVKVIYISYKE